MNDWIVANINNPDFDPSDFKNIAGMTLENTQLLQKEDYLKSDFIKQNPVFLNDEGEFSVDKFNDFYNDKLIQFQEFQENNISQTLELDMFDTDITPNSKIKDTEFSIQRGNNPDRQKIGIEGVNIWSDAEFTKSELAQTSKVWDTEKGEFRNYSPNDHALSNNIFKWFGSLFDDPLVMAVWEQDGEHIDPISKQLKKHKKGEYKLNEEGTYYYETLNGRSAIGKEVLSVMDTLTVDGKGINKYDFFDSDDVEKSAKGVIAKNVVSLLPMFIGGPVATIYASAFIAKEMSKALPMLYSITTSLFGNLEHPEWINTIAAVGYKYSGSTSQYAKENVFSFENFGNLIADVALQWGQQKTIAKAVNKLKGNKDYIKEAQENAYNLYKTKIQNYPDYATTDPNLWMTTPLGQACLKKYLPEAQKIARQSTQLGRDISLAYMAIISNSDVFNDMVHRGASKREAAAVALGSTLGMFAVTKTGLGEAFFDDATEESVKAARAAIKKEIAEASKSFSDIIKSNLPKQQKYLSLIKTAADKSKKFIADYSEDLKYHTTNLYQKMGAEGLEEVSEELVSDVAKSIYELAGDFGFDTTIKDVGAWDNAFERYTMSLIGGAIGGGIFYGKEVLDGKSFKRDTSNEELVTLIRNGHANELKDVLAQLKKKNKIGSTKLSAKNYATTKEGDSVWLTTQNKAESQNDVIADMIYDKIVSLEAIINNNQVNLSDEALFEQMILSEDRFNKYQNISHITNYYQDFNNIIKELISAELDLNKAINSVDGISEEIKTDNDLKKLTDEEKEKRSSNIEKLKKRVEELRKKKNEFLSGEASLDYSRKLNFLMDINLHREFLPLDPEQIWKEHFKNKAITEATEEEQEKFINEIIPEEYKKVYANKELLTKAWEQFKQIEKEISPDLHKLQEGANEYKTWLENIKEIFEINELPEFKYFGPNDILPGESEEDFKFRDTKKITVLDDGTEEIESDIDFHTRLNNRLKSIDVLNDSIDKKIVDLFADKLKDVDFKVDPTIKGFLQQIMPRRVKEMMREKIIQSVALPDDIKTQLLNLNLDLSNVDEVIKNIELIKSNTLKNNINAELDPILNKVSSLIQEIKKADIINPGNEGQTIEEAINDEDYIDQRRLFEELQTYIGNDFSLDDLQNFSLINPNNNIRRYLEHQDNINEIKSNLDNEFNVYFNNINEILNSIQTNAIFDFNSKLETSIKNPLLELIKSFANKKVNGVTIPNLEEILDILNNKYQTIDNIDSLELDEVQLDALYKTKDLLKIIRLYLYAASSTSSLETPIGHNQVFNQFRKTHSELIKKWEELPEVASDYLIIYQQQLNSLETHLDFWIDLNNTNRINKRVQFEKCDAAFIKAQLESLKKFIEKGIFKFKIDDKEYDLVKGLNKLPDSSEDFVKLFNLEKLIYTNFQELLKETKLQVTEILKQSGILDALELNYEDLLRQKTIKLTPQTSYNDFSSYDLLMRFALILTNSPKEFQSFIKKSTEKNIELAPITTQEYSARLTVAATNSQFKEIIKYAYSKTKQDLPLALNTTIITGVAGAGKTQASARFLSYYFKSEDILLAGPTLKQANQLQEIFKNSSTSTIQDILKKILGDTQYVDLISAIQNSEINNSLTITGELSKYISAHNYNGEFKTFFLKPDAPIKFDDKADIPKILIIDEATHLNTIEALILDKYMESIGGHLVLIGDSNQRGHTSSSTGINNIMEESIFTVRSPKLIVSLRDNNIQKQSNLETVRALQDELNEHYLNDSTKDWEKFYPTIKNLLPKLHFKVYQEDEINGDLITSTIDDSIINKISKEGKTIGFIGEKTSAAYIKLKEKGINIENLTEDEVQGQEFDYVIIDSNFKQPENGIELITFLQKLYTLMSRGKEASIFIDNGLSDIIGENEIQKYKAKAPNLKDKINGESAIDILRKKKLNLLNLIDLEESTEKEEEEEEEDNDEEEGEEEEEEKEEEKEEVEEGKKKKEKEEKTKDKGKKKADKSTKKSTKKPVYDSLDFEDYEKMENEEDLKKAINENDKQDEIFEVIESGEINRIQDYINSEFSIPSWSDVSFLNISELSQETITKTVKKKKKKYIVTPWTINKPTEGPLRNLQALIPEGEIVKLYKDKKLWQKQLFDLKSFILFKHNWDDEIQAGIKVLPDCIRENFNREDWEKGTFEIEIRNPNNEVLPIGSSLKKAGLTYKGKDYIVNIVFKVKNKDNKECIFDITGVNNPETLNKNIGLIKANLLAKIDNPKTSKELRAKLQNIYATIEEQAEKYTNIFDQWIDQFDNSKEGYFSKNVTSIIDFNQTTWFVKRKKSHRLGGYTDPNKVQVFKERDLNKIKEELSLEEELATAKDIHNFRERNPHMVISDVHTFTGKELEDISSSVKGKAVVFVSSDTLIPKNLLAKIYIDQKKNPNVNTPRVRMIVLNNYGLTFSQLNSQNFLHEFQGEGDRSIVKKNFLGLRMYTSMWNFRASLLQFKNIYETWCSEHGYTEEKVQKIIQAQDAEYNGDSKSFPDITDTDLKNLKHFNQELLKDIPIFRLGYSRKSVNHIQNFTLNNQSKAYPGQASANFLVISPDKINTYEVLLNKLFLVLHGDSKSKYNLGLHLRDFKGKEFKEEQLIDFENGKHQQALSKLLEYDGEFEQLVIRSNDKSKTSIVEGQEWSYVPLLLSKILNTITYYQYFPENSEDLNKEFAKLIFPETVSSVDNIPEVVVQIGTLLEGKNAVLKTRLTGNEQGHPDRTLADLFDLMFHGTTEDIHGEETPIQITGVFAPNGFLTDPQLSREKSSVGSIDIISEKYNGKAIFYKINTNEGLFTVDVDMRGAGINLPVDKLLGLVSEENKKLESESLGKNTFEEEVDPIEIELRSRFDDDMMTKEELVNSVNNTKKQAFVNSLENITDNEFIQCLDSIFTYKIQDNKIQPVTLKQYLDNLTIKSISSYNYTETGVFVEIDGKIYQVDFENDNLIDSNPEKTIEEIIEDTSLQRLNTFKEYCNGKVSEGVMSLLNLDEFLDDNEKLQSEFEKINNSLSIEELESIFDQFCRENNYDYGNLEDYLINCK